jgi:hypothetical protein
MHVQGARERERRGEREREKERERESERRGGGEEREREKRKSMSKKEPREEHDPDEIAKKGAGECAIQQAANNAGNAPGRQLRNNKSSSSATTTKVPPPRPQQLPSQRHSIKLPSQHTHLDKMDQHLHLPTRRQWTFVAVVDPFVERQPQRALGTERHRESLGMQRGGSTTVEDVNNGSNGARGPFRSTDLSKRHLLIRMASGADCKP